MSGNYTTGEVEFYLLGNLEFQTFALGRCFENPKSISLRARGVDMEGFAKNGTMEKDETNRMDRDRVIMEELFFEEI
jgi:hypothetical protein